MWLATAVLLLTAHPVPKYDWSTRVLPPELIARRSTREMLLRGQGRTRTITSSLTKDGSTAVFVTELGALCLRGDELRPAWKRRFDLTSVYDVAVVSQQRACISTGSEIIAMSLLDGELQRRIVCPQLCVFTALPSGHLVGPVRLPGDSFFTNVMIPFGNDTTITRLLTGNADYPTVGVLNARAVTADRSGTRIAGGGVMSNLWVADIYTQRTRILTTASEEGSFTALCFDPTGRYLIAGFGRCEVMVFDLFQKGRLTLDTVRTSHAYIGLFGREGLRAGMSAQECCGVGFIGRKWMWFTNDTRVFICTWPELDIVARHDVPNGYGQRRWKGSTDGGVLIGVDETGEVTVGHLQELTQEHD